MTAQGAQHGSGFLSSIAFDEDRIRAASIYCSDGRFGEQMDEFLHKGLKLPRYDRLAVPGGPACFTGLVSVFWEGHSGDRQLDFLCRVHGLERLVLISHEGCAFYREWLKVRAEELLARQRADIVRAAARLAKLEPDLAVEGYLARKNAKHIWFEPVPLG
jgi:hypothetical protein